MKSDRPVIVITGGSRGIGRAMTLRLLEKHFPIAVLDILEFPQEDQPSDETTFLFCRCNLMEEAEVNRCIDKVWKKWGRLDVLVNNACIAIFKPFEDKSPDEFAQEMGINLLGAVRTIQAALPYMKTQGYGLIHNVSSGVGITGFPGLSGYVSSKGALEALTRSLKLEFRKYHIAVNLIHPPLTRTVSSAPLGIPQEMMANPETVGKQLADKIMSHRKIITDTRFTRLMVAAIYQFPHLAGRLLSRMTEKATKRG